MSVTVSVVDGLALHGKQTSAARTGGVLVKAKFHYAS